MTYSLRFHPQVHKNYDEAYSWYEEKENGLGERFLKAVRTKIEHIIVNPEAFSSKGNKRFLQAKVEAFPYLVVYKVKKRKKEIYVVSIHHTSKSPRKKYRK